MMVRPQGRVTHRLQVDVTNLGCTAEKLPAGSLIAWFVPTEAGEVNVVGEGPQGPNKLPQPGPRQDQGITESQLQEHWEEHPPTLTAVQSQQLREVILQYADIFRNKLGWPGQAKILPCHINTGDHPPIRKRVRRMAPVEQEVVEKHVQEMLADGVIRPSESPWASPVVLVSKKDGTTRFCIDYRALNEVTKKDVYTLPRIDEVLDALGNSSYRTTLDLVSGYWQTPVVEADKEKTAFVTRSGLYEFQVMPFGLTGAPPLFQRNMDQVLKGLTWKCCLVYIDDIVVYSRTFEQHLQDLKAVFERLRAVSLRVKLSKARFCLEKLEVLGHVVTNEGILPAPHVLAKVVAAKPPCNVTEVRAFLGLVGYYRNFIDQFAKLAEPITALTRANTPFVWSRQCQDAYDELKERLVTEPILAFPNFTKPFILHTDASDVAIGAVLAQRDEEGREKVIGYASKSMSPAERRYTVSERECLAVVHWVKAYRPYLYGSKFEVVTDHQALQWLFKMKDSSSRLTRWSLKLQEYDFTIVHRAGRRHANADAMT